jgi:hypothetical protein
MLVREGEWDFFGTFMNRESDTIRLMSKLGLTWRAWGFIESYRQGLTIEAGRLCMGAIIWKCFCCYIRRVTGQSREMPSKGSRMFDHCSLISAGPDENSEDSLTGTSIVPRRTDRVQETTRRDLTDPCGSPTQARQPFPPTINS